MEKTVEQKRAEHDLHQAQLTRLATTGTVEDRQREMIVQATEIFRVWESNNDEDADVWELATNLASMVLGKPVPVSK